jgi:hypothetical protein
MTVKPSLRQYSAVGADFIKFSNAMQGDKSVSPETKRRFSEIADLYSAATLKASENRGETFGNAHKAWQKDNVGPFVDATAQAKKLLEHPSMRTKIGHIIANPKGDMINLARLTNAVSGMDRAEKIGATRNPGAYAQMPSPLVRQPQLGMQGQRG